MIHKVSQRGEQPAAPRATVVLGLGYGDEGKGSWVDHLHRSSGAKFTLRFNGGAQACHTVTTQTGLQHGFSQFGSGTLAGETKTILSRFMLIEPAALLNEAAALERIGIRDPMSRLIVSEDAPVVTPFNWLLNRIKETARGAARHGSVGFGIGNCQEDVESLGDEALYIRDLRSEESRVKLRRLWSLKIAQAQKYSTPANTELFRQLNNVDVEYYVKLYAHFAHRIAILNDSDIGEIVRSNDTVWEGAQGALLDQSHGFFPFCTRSNTTTQNVKTLLQEWGFEGEVHTVGLLRAYSTRHGAGPLVTEVPDLAVAPCDNTTNVWQGGFRVGWFDAVAARYALEVAGQVDTLAITNLDRLSGLSTLNIGTGYEHTNRSHVYADRIEVIPESSGRTKKRTDALSSVTPTYTAVPGWNTAQDTDSMTRYLDVLESLLEHPIHAYSASADDRKNYRAN